MSGSVTVACKIPSGLELRVMDSVDFDEPVMGGGTRTVQRYHQVGEAVRIKGCSAPHGVPIMLHGGYALTSSVDSDFWDKWLQQNAQMDMVRNRLIFALPREDSAAGKAKDQAEIKSGLERIDPAKPPKTGVEITTAELK